MKKTDFNRVFKLRRITQVLALASGVGFISTAQASLGLYDVYQLAVNNDAKIAQAMAQYEADKETLNSVKGALLPQIQADGSYFINDSSNDYADVNTRDLSITLNQSLYDHANWSRYEQAKYVIEAADLTLKNAQQDLILRVAERYFDVLLAQKNLKLSQTKQEADLTQLETAKASAELGLSSQVDVLEAQSNYDLSKSDTINAENQLDIALEQLANITGKSAVGLKTEGLKALLMDVNLPRVDLQAEQLENRAMIENISVKLAKAQFAQSVEEIDVQKAGHMPTVNFQAQYSDTDYSDFNSGAAFTDSDTTRFGVSVTLPLYSGGRTSSEVKAAKQQSMAAQEALRDSELTAKLDLRTQVRNLQQGQKLVSALREAVKSNDAFLESAEEGYRVGLRSMLEVLTARTNQTNAQRNLIEAIHNQVLNHLRLEATLGNLTVDDIQQYEPLLQVPMTSAAK